MTKRGRTVTLNLPVPFRRVYFRVSHGREVKTYWLKKIMCSRRSRRFLQIFSNQLPLLSFMMTIDVCCLSEETATSGF